MKLFRVLIIFDGAVVLVLAIIFCIGLVDATSEGGVDREDLILWPPLIVGASSILGGGWWLRARGHVRAANGVLLIMAVPALVAGLLLIYLVFLLSRPGAMR